MNMDEKEPQRKLDGTLTNFFFQKAINKVISKIVLVATKEDEIMYLYF